MTRRTAKLKYVARFRYGDALLARDVQEGKVKVFGSNGPFALSSTSNTGAPAIVVGRKGSYGKVNWSPEECFASDTTFFIDSYACDHDLRWLFWLLQTLRLDEGTDEAAVPGLRLRVAYNVDVVVPLRAEQQAIACFLDAKTTWLDALIAKKERLLSLIAERRQALIQHVVTRGLAPLSGVDWLGNLQAHSDVPHRVTRRTAKLKYVARFRYGDTLPTRDAEGNVKVFGSNGPFALSSTSNTGAPAIVVGRKGSYGKVNWSSEECFASDTTFFIDSYACDHDLRWLFWLLQTLRLDEGTDEAAVPGLRLRTASNIDVVVPSYPEQRAIADFLDHETAKIDALVAKVREAIERLKEYRLALISAAVTGKIDVREESAR